MGPNKFKSEKFWVQKHLGSKKILHPKIFGVEIFWGSKNNFVSKTILCPKQFCIQETFVPKNIGPLKILDYFQTSSRQLPNTFQTPSRHPPDSTILTTMTNCIPSFHQREYLKGQVRHRVGGWVVPRT